MDKILLVYDDKKFGNFLDFILKTADFNVILLEDPLLLFEKIAQEKPGLIILDVFITHIDGLYLLEKIRSRKEYESIPILVISSEHNLLLLFDALESGASDFLSAPINEDELIQKVKQFVKI